MKKTLLIVVIFLIIGALALFFLLNKKRKIYDGEISSLVVNLEKVPKDFGVDEEGPWFIEEDLLENLPKHTDQKWIEGYEILYSKRDKDNRQISINVTRYPFEEISKIRYPNKATWSDTIQQGPDPWDYSRIPFPASEKIGDGGVCAFWVFDEAEYGYYDHDLDEAYWCEIKFYKKDIYVLVKLSSRGKLTPFTESDQDLVINIAEEIEKRI